ncbi:hypothetical protein N624_2007 [Levilactobacillus brevis]|nr:hypothetical protein N624_2007 [Levilactobacillus brevis]
MALQPHYQSPWVTKVPVLLNRSVLASWIYNRVTMLFYLLHTVAAVSIV